VMRPFGGENLISEVKLHECCQQCVECVRNLAKRADDQKVHSSEQEHRLRWPVVIRDTHEGHRSRLIITHFRSLTLERSRNWPSPLYI
jgi:hypothetical protein